MCGGRLFQAIPSVTTVNEILKFQKTAKMFQKAEGEYDKGWIHPGSYCFDCEFGSIKYKCLEKWKGEIDGKDQ